MMYHYYKLAGMWGPGTEKVGGKTGRNMVAGPQGQDLPERTRRTRVRSKRSHGSFEWLLFNAKSAWRVEALFVCFLVK